MKHDDSHDEIGTLLRHHKPQPAPSSGLEARILRELDRRQQPAPTRRWVWFVAPAAIAAAVVMMSQPDRSEGEPTRGGGAVNAAGGSPMDEAASPLVEENPLKQESLALSRDARRAGRFLIDCLPSAGN
jgi:hypothetical protein